MIKRLFISVLLVIFLIPTVFLTTGCQLAGNTQPTQKPVPTQKPTPTEKPKKIMPNIVGMSIEKAKEALSEVGCTADIKEVFDESKAGTVISAEITAGTELKYKSSIEVTVSKGSIQNLIDAAEEVSYDDLLRYPESYKSKAVKLEVEITQVETFGLFGVSVVEYYWGLFEGESIKLYDNRDVEEPTIVKGDKITIYGYGDGTSTVGISEKQELGIPILGSISYDKIVDSYTVPCVSFDYVEINNKKSKKK